jgi:hypothetical protein
MISAPSLLLKNRGPIDSSLLFLHVGSLVGFHRTCTPTLTVGILFDCFPDHALTRVLLDYEAKVGVWTLHRVGQGVGLHLNAGDRSLLRLLQCLVEIIQRCWRLKPLILGSVRRHIRRMPLNGAHDPSDHRTCIIVDQSLLR